MASPIWAGAAEHSGWAQYGDPGGVPRVPVADIVCSLQFYLDEMGCVVREVADGWVLLRSGPFAVLLVHEPTPVVPARLHAAVDPPTDKVHLHRGPRGADALIPPLLIRLSTPDVRALRERLGCHVLSAGVGLDSVEEIEVFDPDRHRVVVRQLGSCSSSTHGGTCGSR